MTAASKARADLGEGRLDALPAFPDSLFFRVRSLALGVALAKSEQTNALLFQQVVFHFVTGVALVRQPLTSFGQVKAQLRQTNEVMTAPAEKPHCDRSPA